MPLSKHSVGTYPETNSHATCQGTFGHSRQKLGESLWTDAGIKSGISVRELISTLKKSRNILLKSSQARKEVTKSFQSTWCFPVYTGKSIATTSPVLSSPPMHMTFLSPSWARLQPPPEQRCQIVPVHAANTKTFVVTAP